MIARASLARAQEQPFAQATVSAVEGEDAHAPDPDESETAADPARIRYRVEQIVVRGNHKTQRSVVEEIMPLRRGSVFDAEDPRLEVARYRLLGTGLFRSVAISLERGSRRGEVLVVVEVTERNTFVISEVTAGVTNGVLSSEDRNVRLFPYGGFGLSELNLGGTGVQLNGSFVLSEPQQAVRLRFVNPRVFGTDNSLIASASYHNARDFFGNEHALVNVACPGAKPDGTIPPCPTPDLARNAVVAYQRVAVSVGTAADLGNSFRYSIEWRGDYFDVLALPLAASETRAGVITPIDFAINRGTSLVSALQLGLVFDERDNNALPTRGTYANVQTMFASRIFGSSYEFLRIQALVQHHIPLPHGSLRLGILGGLVFGKPPFVYKFYHSDLSDLVPSRVLDLNLDRRGTPNLLGTAIQSMRHEEIAIRADVEYSIELARGDDWLHSFHLYVNVGVYSLMRREEAYQRTPAYSGASAFPIDLTFDVGFRADTEVGLFQFGLSNVIGFVTP